MERAKIVLEYTKAMIWPITLVIILSIFHSHIGEVLGRIKSAELPGGTKLNLYELMGKAKEVSLEIENDFAKKVQDKGSPPLIELTEANKKMVKLGLAPSTSGLDLSYYRNLVKENPSYAFFALRLEVETMLRNLAKGSKIVISSTDSTNEILHKLKDDIKITSKQFEFITKILKICNAVIDGHKVTEEEANEILDIASVLRDDYVAWLSWGAEKNLTENNE